MSERACLHFDGGDAAPGAWAGIWGLLTPEELGLALTQAGKVFDLDSSVTA